MLDKLRSLYPNLIPLNDHDPQYVSFQLSGQTYGIPKTDLTDEAKNLITTLFHTNEATIIHDSWHQYVTGNRSEPPETLEAFRLLAFNHVDEAQTAIEDVLNKSLIILSNPADFVIGLEPLTVNEEPFNFNDVIDVLSNDLDVKMTIFQSNVLKNIKQAPDLFHWLEQSVQTLFLNSHKRVISHQDALLPILTTNLTPNDRYLFKQALLQDALRDYDLLETITTVIEHQVNISSVAKHHYMHRNTVQKRIDKFYELTGLDVRQFDDALVSYLCLNYL
ncbi:hypothetical protein ABID56_001129 [Alkalibacillus flavidus]|uniref:PucR C-terminal helix-turn-helix domain-containing protein n=1 Tax=Alkalibacillus flavidus TaxID=546021 RepID=A0ABV2KTX9_9BACI